MTLIHFLNFLEFFHKILQIIAKGVNSRFSCQRNLYLFMRLLMNAFDFPAHALYHGSYFYNIAITTIKRRPEVVPRIRNLPVRRRVYCFN